MIYGKLPDSFWQGMQTLVAEDARARMTPGTAHKPATAAAAPHSSQDRSSRTIPTSRWGEARRRRDRPVYAVYGAPAARRATGPRTG